MKTWIDEIRSDLKWLDAEAAASQGCHEGGGDGGFSDAAVSSRNC
jgi:hypothetical protein